MDTIGERLKFLIDEKHLNQKQFGELIETSRQTISNYVNNLAEPKYDFCIKLNQKLDVNLNWFIANNGEPYNTAQFEQVEKDFTQRVREILKQEGLIK